MNIIIEIPAGSTSKIEIKDGVPVEDRKLPIPCPYNYGYIEGTMSPDGDPLDVFVLGNFLPTLTKIEEYRVLGYFECEDGGVKDDKIVAYPGMYYPYDVDWMLFEIDHYLRTYKEGFKVISWNFGELMGQKLIVDSKVS